jgi:hypothetical protein
MSALTIGRFLPALTGESPAWVVDLQSGIGKKISDHAFQAAWRP